MIRVPHVVVCPIFVFVFLFHGPYWKGGVLELVKNYHFFSIFSPLGHFLQVVWQVKG